MGRGHARPARGDVRVLPRRARVGARRARARPARQEAAVPAGAATTAALRLASSLPALVAAGGVDTSVDPVALHHYLSFHSIVPAPRTILRGVRKLPPATVLVVEPDGRRRERRYWDPPFERDPARADWSAEDWEDAVLDALRVAVRRRMVSDVPVGILLSGGLDSSLIVALLAEQGQTRAGDVLGRLPRRRRPRRRRVRVLRPRGARVRHRPPPDPRRAGAAAAGAAARDRGDERADGLPRRGRVLPALRGGREAAQGRAVRAGRRRGVRRLLLVPAAARGRRATGSTSTRARSSTATTTSVRALLAARRRLDDDPSRALRGRRGSRAPGAATAIDRGLRLDAEVMLVDDPVKRVDNMTMAHGLEARTPFLDHELVELAAPCPPELKLADGGKGVLKRAARGIVPDAVIDRPKGYFPVPALSHLEGPVLELVADALRSERGARPRAVPRGRGRGDAARRPTSTARTSTARRCGSSACSSCGCRRTWLSAALAGGDRGDRAGEGAPRHARASIRGRCASGACGSCTRRGCSGCRGSGASTATRCGR